MSVNLNPIHAFLNEYACDCYEEHTVIIEKSHFLVDFYSMLTPETGRKNRPRIGGSVLHAGIVGFTK